MYKQDFFNNLYEELGIALENIVYYKVGTYYQCLLAMINLFFHSEDFPLRFFLFMGPRYIYDIFTFFLFWDFFTFQYTVLLTILIVLMGYLWETANINFRRKTFKKGKKWQ